MSNDITVRLKAQTTQFTKAMADSSKSVGDFARNNEEMARRVAKAGAVTVTAVAAIGAAVLKMASEAAQAGVEIRNLSAVAGTSTTNFQRMADASRTVGVEQEKLSDILKDVNDKFGDYMATGAGPLADFFDNIAPKIGVTAEQFANLAGPDALQLYVDSLERAGVNQQQMTFYMEALASDATRLLPLLRNNGTEMSRLGDEAQRAGRILSEDMIQGAVELDRELANLSNQLKTQATAAVLEYKDEIIGLINFITDTLIPSIGAFLKWVNDGVEGWRILGRAANGYLQTLKEVAKAPNAFDPQNLAGPGGGATFPNGLPPNLGGGGGGATSDLTDFLGRIDAGEMQGPQTPEGFAPSMSGTPLDPTGGLLPEQSPLEMARMAWEAQQELQEEIESGTQTHSDRLADIAARQIEQEERLREAASRREIQIRSKTTNMAIGLLANLGKESEVFAKAAVALNAAKSISEAIQNTSVAYTKALTVDPTGAMASRVALLGKAQIGIIAANAALSLSGGGGSSGGGGGSAGSSVGAGAGGGAGGAAQQQEVTTFSFTLQNDPMGFGESFARQMIEQLNSAQRDGGRIQAVLT